MHLITVYELIEAAAKRSPQSVALLAPGRLALRYGDLQEHILDLVNRLNRLGIGRNDRVAIVLPNGPEMAVAFLSVASCATSAPLNPAYRASEFDFYLSDLNAKALITLAGAESAALEVARARSIPLIGISGVSDGHAGMFTMAGSSRPLTSTTGLAEPDDVALVLHTSGTTSRPKIVPLTHTNLCASAQNIRTTLQLTETDRCLNVMPLFHIHGLIGAVLSSLAAGASIACTAGFNESNFFEWMKAMRPTWYTAVPTMHQAVLSRAEENRDVITQCPLRFIRSSSSSLPPQVMSQLESTFKVPVIESYGMTEAAHQMASNPLPPRRRKPGSVGVSAGPDVAIMDEVGTLLPAGSTGEIVIRGANVTGGYENNPSANERAFTNGWFRTGDTGYMDGEGYLFISGRLKEIINRGGEKVMPREVDEALMDHPGIAQAVAFAVPHPRLGEDVAAAVVLREDAVVTEKEIREFAFARLADHKVPSHVLIVTEIPKGPTGKLQRIGLAEKLGSKLKPIYTPPRNEVEERLARIWASVLGIDRVGVYDNFFMMGGDSLMAARVANEMRAALRKKLPISIVFRSPTIDQLAGHVAQDSQQLSRTSLVLLKDGDSATPIFCLPGTLSNVFTYLGTIAERLGTPHQVYGLQDGVENPSPIRAHAATYVAEIRSVQPKGPYLLVGVCSGGAVAFEMARQLHAGGERVALLALVEPTPPYLRRLQAYRSFARYVVDRFKRHFLQHAQTMSELGSSERGFFVRQRLKVLTKQWAVRRYVPEPFPGRVHLFLTAESLTTPAHPRLKWRDFALSGSALLEIEGTHGSITGYDDAKIDEAHQVALAERLGECIRECLKEE